MATLSHGRGEKIVSGLLQRIRQPGACRDGAMSADHVTWAALAAIHSVEGTLMLARALVEVGRRVDLEGLDRDVATLCAAVLRMEPDAGRGMRPAMERLLRQLDRLTLSLPRPDAR
jgi:hypothetical protein